MQVEKVIKIRWLLYWVGKLGYLRNKHALRDLQLLEEGRFWLYNVDGFFIASEGFSWYLTKEYLIDKVNRISCRYYQLRQGNTVVDIGAGLGEESSIYSELVGTAGRIYSIEANPKVYKCLTQVVKHNKLANVTAYNVAVNAANTTVEIEDNPANYLGSTLNGHDKTTSYQVEGVTLETFCQRHNITTIDFLKVNIEGAERFLAGAFQSPTLRIRNVAISCHDFRYPENYNEFFVTKEIVTNYLTAAGYTIQQQHTGEGYIDDWVYGTKS
ncbi:FkbM family methyltransferase [Solirubrum puertoriconensis]|uniref:Methyltransferase FkbM domain-containing protein n=1 Tax=Solirubrum puertoriconensis TaxID=1751427 RepID=A0A9X0L511_SOLP1|nr:FkbM family methyltransferase [Solirubrum puertoriconensis]KUG08055.1 hypothetical protein ASU33_07575 [Solirubrum puertoriconensis]